MNDGDKKANELLGVEKAKSEYGAGRRDPYQDDPYIKSSGSWNIGFPDWLDDTPKHELFWKVLLAIAVAFTIYEVLSGHGSNLL